MNSTATPPPKTKPKRATRLVIWGSPCYLVGELLELEPDAQERARVALCLTSPLEDYREDHVVWLPDGRTLQGKCKTSLVSNTPSSIADRQPDEGRLQSALNTLSAAQSKADTTRAFSASYETQLQARVRILGWMRVEETLPKLSPRQVDDQPWLPN